MSAVLQLLRLFILRPVVSSEGLGRGIHQFVVLDELKGLFERQQPARRRVEGIIVARCPHVAELLYLCDVHVHVALTGVLSHDHALIDHCVFLNIKLAAWLEMEEAVGRCFSRLLRDKGAAYALKKETLDSSG